jgi:hypothetical protein
LLIQRKIKLTACRPFLLLEGINLYKQHLASKAVYLILS